ncbi:MAG: peptide chain release factor N(5)-glutamine methyltransferase [Bacteroidota bacterium]
MDSDKQALQPLYTQGSRTWYQQSYAKLVHLIGDPQEAEALTKRLLTHYIGYTDVGHVLDKPISISPQQAAELQHAVHRVGKHEPLQYVLGYAEFCGRRFSVAPSVLIPRPTTAMMTMHILSADHKDANALIDLCTGSGCIAITLAKAFPKAAVHALDISPAALTMAKQNAITHQTDIIFHQLDLLKAALPAGQWDIIVSNPPYVLMKEKQEMHVRVLDYEPHEALFVPDHAPLCFYRRITSLAPTSLRKEGWLYMEINERWAHQVAGLCMQAGLKKVTIYQDFFGKDRWVAAQK